MEAAASETLGPGEREAKPPEQTRAAPVEVWTVVAAVLQVCAFFIFLATSSRVLDSHEIREIVLGTLKLRSSFSIASASVAVEG